METITRELTTSADQVKNLVETAQGDESFEEFLIASLAQAKSLAQAQLDAGLLAALSWPTDLASYVEYLDTFSKWAPQQSKSEVWEAPGTDEHQEVYDRLCHFYFLIDQEVGPDKTIVENVPWFSEWLIGYASLWGSYLNTPDSFNEEILNSYIDYSPKFRVQDSMIGGKPNSPSGWLTFNQFFARELNPGLRPTENPFSNKTVTSPADCTFKAKYDIGPDSTIPEITVKKTHKFASVETLLEGSQYKSSFANGSFAHYFLGPYSYHRFHAPVAGLVKECYPLQGLVYLDVNLSGGQFDAPDSSQGGYEFAQARGIITIDTTNSPYGNVGIVAVIPIGMCQVSSVNMTATVGQETLKCDEFGYFLFGGSDIIVLFQDGVNPVINTSTDYHHYGSEIATCTPLVE